MEEYVKIWIENKDLFTSIILIGIIIVIILPLVWYFIHNYNKSIKKIVWIFTKYSEKDNTLFEKINDNLTNLNHFIKKHDENSKEQFNIIKNNFWRFSLKKDDAINIIQKSMLSSFYKKIDFLEKRLLKNNIYERENIIKRQIKTELLKLSDEEYLFFLEWFIYNWVKLSDYVKKHFPFNEFLEEIYDCIFDKDIVNNSTKLKNILEIMKVYQNETIEKIKKEL